MPEIIYRLYGREDIALSLNSFKLCNLTSKIFNMNLIEKHDDWNNQRNEEQIITEFKRLIEWIIKSTHDCLMSLNSNCNSLFSYKSKIAHKESSMTIKSL